MDEWGLHKVKVFRDESGHTRLFLDGNDISKRCFGFKLEQVGDDAARLTLQVQCRAEIELDAAVAEEDPPAWADGCDWTLYGSKKEDKENGVDAEDIDPLGSFRAPNDWTSSTLRIIVRDAVRIRHAFIRLFILNGAAIAIGIVLLLLKVVR